MSLILEKRGSFSQRGGGGLVPTMPGCVCPKVKDIGHLTQNGCKICPINQLKLYQNNQK